MGVVGRAAVKTGANLKRGDVDDGGVGGSSGCIGRGDGGKGAMERTVAIVRDGSRGGIFSKYSAGPVTNTDALRCSEKACSAAVYCKSILGEIFPSLLEFQRCLGCALVVRGDIGILVASCQCRRWRRLKCGVKAVDTRGVAVQR